MPDRIVPRSSRGAVLATLATVAGVGLAAVVPAAAPAATPTGRCVVKGGSVVKTSRFARLWRKQVERSQGAETRVYACLRSQRPRLLETYDAGLEISFSRVVFDQAAVGYRVRATDESCSQYQPNEPCATYVLRGFDFSGRRAHRGASVVKPGGVAKLDVTKGGRLVWLTRPAADGQRRLYTTTGRATTLVDTGDIDPKTVGVGIDGVTFGWEKDGEARSGQLD